MPTFAIPHDDPMSQSFRLMRRVQGEPDFTEADPLIEPFVGTRGETHITDLGGWVD